MALMEIRNEPPDPMIAKLADMSDWGSWHDNAMMVGQFGARAESAIPTLLIAFQQTNNVIQAHALIALGMIRSRPEKEGQRGHDSGACVDRVGHRRGNGVRSEHVTFAPVPMCADLRCPLASEHTSPFKLPPLAPAHALADGTPGGRGGDPLWVST